MSSIVAELGTNSIVATIGAASPVVATIGAASPVVAEINMASWQSVPYSGSYTATPTTSAQVLSTSGKTMTSDFTVSKIPYSEASNPSGGNTVTIG